MERGKKWLKVVDVIIPAFNEEASIAHVVNDIPRSSVREIIVVSNGSTDRTEQNARTAGATVLREEQKGYGYACLKGMAHIAKRAPSDLPGIIVFLDGDYSDYPGEMPQLIKPIQEDGYEMVIGSRVLGKRQKGSLTPQQIFGNWLATRLIKWLYGVKFTDLGPFRAVSYEKLMAMRMADKTYGWTVEMQVKAAKMGIASTEVPVNYRQRIGKSKVSGTVKGTILAGYKIIWTIFKLL